MIEPETGITKETESIDTGRLFDAYYYAHSCGRPYQRDDGWLNFFGAIADRIVSDIGPNTVLDAGCALGFLVEALRNRRVASFGIDISEYAIQNVHPDIQPYCSVGKITQPFPQTYDLITCFEVVEHMPPDESRQTIENICQHTDDVLFSSTPFDYKEATHFNVQAPEYWGELFAQQGFFRDVDFDASFITPWAVRFRRSQDPVHRLVRDYERKFWLLWKENVDLRSLMTEIRDQLPPGATGAVAMAAPDKEIARLRELVAAYERGYFIRFMRRLREWKTKLLGRNRPG